MKDLYIDFDGVILDTIKEGYNQMTEQGLDYKNSDDCIQFFSNLNWKDFINKTPQINDSILNIKKIIDSKKYRVSILTHVISIEEAMAKINYIRKHLSNVTIIPVPKQISKTKMVNSENAILIDDYAGNLREWEASGGIGVRFSMKLNGKGFQVINKLDSILDLDI